ncbi:MAG: D-alanine--D-alanine ligase [Rhodospirillales bacterium]|nr:D-alanine--D-alanine ligase [Rhodospirillales bacterium]
MTPSVKRLAVITGDHALADPTKRDGRYHDEDERTHEAMKDAFRSLSGFTARVLSEHRSLLDDLRRDPPDLAVNFCDTGFGNIPTQELHIAAYLELLGIPYTGAPPAAMAICYDKAIVRVIAQSLGVPVPREAYLPADGASVDLPDLLPALIKPNTGDGSVGITKDAVVRTRAEATAYLHWLRSSLPGRDALIQEYLPGAEYGVGLIGNPETGLIMLPPLEVDFGDLPAGLTPILSFESKAVPESPYWTEIKFKRADLTPMQAGRLEGWCKCLFRRFALRDYARFDFRVGVEGEAKLMEVNPNPAWAYDGKLALMAGFAGIEYRDMLRLILEAAIARLARGA